jgi:hypothetical protein
MSDAAKLIAAELRKQGTVRLDKKLWRINYLYHIVTDDGDKVRFRMNAEQVDLYKKTFIHNWHIILKARQLGFTTLIALYFLDEVLFNKNVNALIICDTEDNAKKVMANKIKFALNNIDPSLQFPVGKSNEGGIVINHDNGKSPSTLSVGVSARGGTYQLLHVSEYGEISNKYPQKAVEIKTSSIPAAKKGKIFIESTAKGNAGQFHDLCQTALTNTRQNAVLNEAEFMIHFYPWYKAEKYSMGSPQLISPLMQKYFEKLEQSNGIVLNDYQKNWYSSMDKILQDKMKQEYPATPEEAFEQAVEGAVYGRQFVELDKEQRILDIAHDAMSPVFTAWDIGNSDTTAIWFYQIKHGGWIDFIDYYEMNKADANHYVSLVHGKNYRYGKHKLPHDANKQGVAFSAITSQKLLSDAGLRDIDIIPRTENILDDISFTRTRFAQVRFNKNNPMVIEGVKKLRNYQFGWNEKFGRWSDTPIHNDVSHCADAFRYAIVSLPKDIATLVNFVPQEKPKPLMMQQSKSWMG